MIKPSIGRVVWYWPGGKAQRETEGQQPCAALIAHVHSDNCVNLAVFDSGGHPYSRMSVALEQEPGDCDGMSSFCCWMPFQIGQAKQLEANEEPLKD